MKRITPDELPAVLTEDVVQILVEMSIEFPKTTFDWADVSQLLEERGQLQFVLEKVQKYNKKRTGQKEKVTSMKILVLLDSMGIWVNQKQ